MSDKDEMNEIKNLPPQFWNERKELNEMIDRKIDLFIQDMRELGQTEMAAGGPGYELSFKISPKDPQ